MSKWWGEFEVARDETRLWRIGPLSLLAQREQDVWHIGTATGDDPADESVETHLKVAQGDLPSDAEFERIVAPSKTNVLTIAPRLADRLVVARPDEPFLVPPKTSVTVYVGTPVWLHLSADGATLKEIPVFRPSDTWFGPTTEGGVLCYAARSPCRTQTADVRRLPHRAVTAVLIENRAETALAFQRISIPAPRLALFAANDGRLWTEDVDFVRTEDSDFAELSIRDGPPKIDAMAELIAEGRRPHENVVVRAFASLLG